MTKILRKNNLRWIGLPILLMGVFAYYMIEVDKSVVLRFGVPLVFIIWGGMWLSKPSRYVLFIEHGELCWEGVEGKNKFAGKILISEINKIELLKKGSSSQAGVQWVEVMAFTDKENYTLPRNLNFGGTAKPKIKDVLDELQKINSSIKFEMKDLVEHKYIN